MTDHRDYRTYVVRNAQGERIGEVDAQGPAQAVFRLMGGEWGRTDYTATEKEPRR